MRGKQRRKKSTLGYTNLAARLGFIVRTSLCYLYFSGLSSHELRLAITFSTFVTSSRNLINASVRPILVLFTSPETKLTLNKTLVIKGLIHRVTCRCGDVCPCLFRTKKRNKVKESVSKKSCLPTLAVKVLEISGYGGTRREIQQMRHFLVNLKCLEVVKIGVVQQEVDNKYLKRKLMSLPRLSSKCLIQFI
ncbi:BnaCnng15290D [Brassica napus]|uniref:BnaCnng15290D protein n=3 Tax=Brassica TaxID=3705 RepID=A0A078IC36_BRANA|nr:BnaCnng15290D [Brassica napus]VDD45167.1 unnamed protein product [Brassica oleracea]